MRRLNWFALILMSLPFACGSQSGPAASQSPTVAASPLRSPSPSPVSCGNAVLTPPASEPSLVRAAMAYDEATEQVILVGSKSGTSPDSETWAWTPRSGWKKLTPAHSPSGRTVASMAYSPANKQAVLFGGQGVPGLDPLSDTWTWNGTDWTLQSPVNSPPAVVVTSMAYDPGSQTVIAILDNDSALTAEMWAWNGANWAHLAPAQTPNYPKQGAGIAYAPAMSVDVMYGTVYFTIQPPAPPDPSTWTYASSTWTKHVPAGANPAARMRPGMSTDKLGGAVMFGGGGANNVVYGDTWTWLGKWTLRHPTKQPAKRARPLMAYDAACGVVVLYGGELQTASSLRHYFDTWVWGGVNWSKVG